MQPQDEFVHEYPKPLDSHWKENWYFNFIDRDAGAWGINHVSLERHKQTGRFTALHVVDGKMLLYSNVIDIEDELPEITDGKLKFEFVEPEKRFRLTFNGPRHQVDLEYTARFPVFDYESGAKDKSDKRRELSLNHYEQALFCKGALTLEGKERTIDCFGHRDHSWGYRNESKVGGWNWVAAQFPDKTINMSLVDLGDKKLSSGFVSTTDGNARIKKVSVADTDFQNKCPTSSVFTAVDEQGREWKLKSQKFSSLYLPMKEKGKGVVVHENFADYQNLDTGETGVGIDEYLINPDH